MFPCLFILNSVAPHGASVAALSCGNIFIVLFFKDSPALVAAVLGIRSLTRLRMQNYNRNRRRANISGTKTCFTTKFIRKLFSIS